jgi:hypothetical protein
MSLNIEGSMANTIPQVSKFLMVRDSAGFNSYGLKPPGVGSEFQAILTAGIEDTVTVPSYPYANTTNVVVIFDFAPGSMVWVAYNQAAELPTGSFRLTTSESNPTIREVQSGDVIHFITNDASDEVGVIFYPNY